MNGTEILLQIDHVLMYFIFRKLSLNSQTEADIFVYIYRKFMICGHIANEKACGCKRHTMIYAKQGHFSFLVILEDKKDGYQIAT